jgi:hypothetical protein
MEHAQENLPDSEYIIIPNPIYDVVFRYLMEDAESARIVLSTLINENIKRIELELLTHAAKGEDGIQRTDIVDPKSNDHIRLFHLDFTAIVEKPDGSEEFVMIELQKASEPDDIFRFKRYISRNFQHRHQKEIANPRTRAIEVIDTPIRLIPIFILNFRIEREVNDLLISINRVRTGVFTNTTLKQANEFIDHLSFDMLVVQLPNLHKISEEDYARDDYKRRLYALLKLFDQKSKVRDNEHRLRLIRRFFPGFLDRVIRRLQAADSENADLEEQMYAEDEYLRALIARDNEITFLSEELDKKEQVISEKEQVISEKEQVISEKDKVILEYAKMLKSSGLPIEDIRQKTGLSLELLKIL